MQTISDLKSFSFGQFLEKELKDSKKIQVQYCLGHDHDSRQFQLIDASDCMHRVQIAKIYHSNVVILLDLGLQYRDDIEVMAKSFELLNPGTEVTIVIPG